MRTVARVAAHLGVASVSDVTARIVRAGVERLPADQTQTFFQHELVEQLWPECEHEVDAPHQERESRAECLLPRGRATASGRTAVAGAVPALATTKRSPAFFASSASAIWLRAEFPVHGNSTRMRSPLAPSGADASQRSVTDGRQSAWFARACLRSRLGLDTLTVE